MKKLLFIGLTALAVSVSTGNLAQADDNETMREATVAAGNAAIQRRCVAEQDFLIAQLRTLK